MLENSKISVYRSLIRAKIEHKFGALRLKLLQPPTVHAKNKTKKKTKHCCFIIFQPTNSMLAY